jgi:hypothetical protein
MEYLCKFCKIELIEKLCVSIEMEYNVFRIKLLLGEKRNDNMFVDKVVS